MKKSLFKKQNLKKYFFVKGGVFTFSFSLIFFLIILEIVLFASPKAIKGQTITAQYGCSCSKYTCIGKTCKDLISGKSCQGTLAPDCTPDTVGMAPNGCGVCCNDTCENLGYQCGKFPRCGVPDGLICGDENNDGEPDCSCTDTCYIGNEKLGIAPETTCVGNKIYTCGQDSDDRDTCYEFVDDPGKYTECQGACFMKDAHNAECSCDSECAGKGMYCNNNIYGSFIDLCVESEERKGCFDKIKNYFKCADGCIEPEPGAATCRCEDECSNGNTKCEVVSEKIKINGEWQSRNKYFEYGCGEAKDFDKCKDWANKSECSYGCNDDLTGCAACKNECYEGGIKCLPYDGDGDGISEAKAIYTCGFKDNKDKCSEWTGPEPCLGEYYCKQGQKVPGCFCNDCEEEEKKCVDYPVKRWKEVDGIWDWHYVLEPRQAICRYDKKLGCNVWSNPKPCENDPDQSYSLTERTADYSAANYLNESGMKCVYGKGCAKCVNECSALGQKRCVDNNIYTCLDNNKDGCFEWSSPLPCQHGCKSEGYGLSDNCAYSCRDVDECKKSGKVCKEIDGVYFLYSCGEANDGDDCLDIITDQMPTFCTYGCVPLSSQCNSSCDNGCKREGQEICKDIPWIFGSNKSYIFVCTKKDPKNICFDLVKSSECHYGCNAAETACIGTPDECINSEEVKCIDDNLYICKKQLDGHLMWVYQTPPCAYGCLPDTDKCSTCKNAEGCFKDGEYVCMLDKRYQCKDINGDGCLEKAFVESCEFGCPIPNPYFSSECNPCPFDCKNPGPPYDDNNPNNKPKESFSCGKYFICGKKDGNGQPDYDCGICPKDCRSEEPFYRNYIRYDDKVCEYVWDGIAVYSTDNVRSCYDIKAEKTMGGYKYSKGILEPGFSSDGFTYYEICREPSK